MQLLSTCVNYGGSNDSLPFNHQNKVWNLYKIYEVNTKLYKYRNWTNTVLTGSRFLVFLNNDFIFLRVLLRMKKQQTNLSVTLT